MRIDLYEVAEKLDISYTNLGFYIQKNEKLQDLIECVEVQKNGKTASGKIYKRGYRTRTIDTCDFEEFARIFNLMRYGKGKRQRADRNGLISWTETALICYKNNLTCKGCSQKEYCETAYKTNPYLRGEKIYFPPLKKITLEILAKLGKPPNYLLDEV